MQKVAFSAEKCETTPLQVPSWNIQNPALKSWTGCKGKNKDDFLVVSFKISSLWSLWKFSKVFFACIGCFWLFTKIKKELVLVINEDFLYSFSIKMFLTKYPINWPRSCIVPNFLISLQRYQTKCVSKIFFRQLMTSEALRFSFIIFSSNGWQKEKERSGKRS